MPNMFSVSYTRHASGKEQRKTNIPNARRPRVEWERIEKEISRAYADPHFAAAKGAELVSCIFGYALKNNLRELTLAGFDKHQLRVFMTYIWNDYMVVQRQYGWDVAAELLAQKGFFNDSESVARTMAETAVALGGFQTFPALQPRPPKVSLRTDRPTMSEPDSLGARLFVRRPRSEDVAAEASASALVTL